jgi:hypothetical protein
VDEVGVEVGTIRHFHEIFEDKCQELGNHVVNMWSQIGGRCDFHWLKSAHEGPHGGATEEDWMEKTHQKAPLVGYNRVDGESLARKTLPMRLCASSVVHRGQSVRKTPEHLLPRAGR